MKAALLWLIGLYVFVPADVNGQDSCRVEGIVVAAGQAVAGVQIHLRQPDGTRHRVAETENDGTFTFETQPIPANLLRLVLYFEKSSVGSQTRLLRNMVDGSGCPVLSPPKTSLARQISSSSSSISPSVLGQTIYVVKFDVYPESRQAQEAHLNKHLHEIIDHGIRAYWTRLDIIQPLIEISIKQLGEAISTADGEEVRRRGSSLNALGMITGQGEIRETSEGNSFMDLISDFRVIPVYAHYREFRIQSEDSLPFAEGLSPLQISKGLQDFWGAKAIIALTVKDLSSTQSPGRRQLESARQRLYAVRHTMMRDDPLLNEVEMLISHLDGELRQ